MRTIFLLVVLTLSFAISSARAAQSAPPDDFTCTFRHNIHEVESLAEIPAVIRAKLPAPMANKGEDFNPSDAVSGNLPFNRFIRAGYIGELVFVWYEYGGRAYGQTLRLLARSPSDDTPIMSLALPATSRSGNLCAQTDAILDIVLPTRDYRTCKFKPEVTEVNSLKDIPVAIRDDLPTPLADKGQAFNEGDVIIIEPDKPLLPNDGLQRVGYLGPRWFVWIYQGGGAVVSMQTRIYDASGKRLATLMGWDNLCARTEAMLSAPIEVRK